MRKNKKAFRFLINMDILIASVALVILVGCTFAGVIARYVLGKPFGWIEEIQAAFIVWVVFAAGGAAYRTGNHSAIEIVFETLPSSAQKIVSVFIGVVVTAVLGFLCYTSIGYLQLFLRTGRTTAVLNIPYTWIYLIVPISCVLQICNYFLVNVFGYDDEVETFLEEDNGDE